MFLGVTYNVLDDQVHIGSRYNVPGYDIYMSQMIKFILVLVIMFLGVTYTCLR